MKNSHYDYNITEDSKKADCCPRSDLACESGSITHSDRGTDYNEYEKAGMKISELLVQNKDGEDATGKKQGRYVTVYCPVMRGLDGGVADALSEIISELLQDFVKTVTGHEVTSRTKVLVAGLGNRFITADAIGPRTADKVAVTGHMMGGGGIFDRLGCCSLSAVHPGVMGQTGIEAAEMIRGASEAVCPDVIIAVDALAARATERLAATVQLSDAGIEPGSGIGNRRRAIDKEHCGAPVIALGVPTVVDSSTLVYDALEKAGIGSPDEKLRQVLSEGRSFFVSLRDSDVICDEVSTLLAESINRAFFAEGL